MRGFLLKTGLFSIIFILAVVVLNIYANKRKILKSCHNISLNSEILFLGNSHPECALNDVIIKNSINLSNSGECYFYTYQKTKALLNCNIQAKTVFIQFSPIELTTKWDSAIWEKKYLLEFLPQYISVLSLDENLFVFKKNPRDFLKCYFVTAIMKNMGWCNFANIKCLKKIWGGYRSLERDIDSSDIKNMEKERIIIFGENNIVYLSKTLEILKERNIAVVLVSMPIASKNYSTSTTNKFLEIKKENFPSETWLDFSSFPLNLDDYADLGHLNYKGSKKFSVFFNSLIEQGLLESSDKEVFVKRALELLPVSDKNL